MVDSYYMVPVVDGNDAVRVVKALDVDHIATLAAGRDRGYCDEASADQGFRGEARPASGKCGDAGRHGQPGSDAHACGE
jgi:hypothetical protein